MNDLWTVKSQSAQQNANIYARSRIWTWFQLFKLRKNLNWLFYLSSRWPINILPSRDLRGQVQEIIIRTGFISECSLLKITTYLIFGNSKFWSYILVFITNIFAFEMQPKITLIQNSKTKTRHRFRILKNDVFVASL